MTALVRQDCDRCEARGRIPAFAHVADGVCFACEGKGFVLVPPADVAAQARRARRTAEAARRKVAVFAAEKAARFAGWAAAHERVARLLVENGDLPEVASLVEFIGHEGRVPEGRLEMLPGWLFTAGRLDAAVAARDLFTKEMA